MVLCFGEKGNFSGGKGSGMAEIFEKQNSGIAVYIAEIPADAELGIISHPRRQSEIEETKNAIAKSEKYFVWRLLERAVVAEYGRDAGEMTLEKNENGKWISGEFSLSLTHGGGAVALALAPSEISVGVDIEPLDKAVTEKLSEGEKPAAPGMKYRHYAPVSPVILLDGSDEKRVQFMSSFVGDESVALVCFSEDSAINSAKNAVVIGSKYDQAEQAHRLFSLLRAFDDKSEIKKIYAPLPDKSGIGLAIFNRMLKASGYSVVTL